ncbi:hypothetical protein M8C21_004253, partial [Ambrosia artemisiifolia]
DSFGSHSWFFFNNTNDDFLISCFYRVVVAGTFLLPRFISSRCPIVPIFTTTTNFFPISAIVTGRHRGRTYRRTANKSNVTSASLLQFSTLPIWLFRAFFHPLAFASSERRLKDPGESKAELQGIARTNYTTRIKFDCRAPDKLQMEYMKTVNGDDLLWAMATTKDPKSYNDHWMPRRGLQFIGTMVARENKKKHPTG